MTFSAKYAQFQNTVYIGINLYQDQNMPLQLDNPLFKEYSTPHYMQLCANLRIWFL